MEQVGYTTLIPGTAEAWRAALPDPTARDNLVALAVQAAAGAIAETEVGGDKDSPEHRGDLQGIVQIGAALGYGTSSDDQAMRQFMGACVERADRVLSQDGGRAWAAVTDALAIKGVLSGREVARLIDRADRVNPATRSP